MSHSSEAHNLEVTQQNSHLFSERVETRRKAAAHRVPFAAMVLNRSGTVRSCHDDAARLFCASADALVGRHVSELIPHLPFKPRTPGYNVAYSTFWASEGPQRGFCGVDTQGRLFGLQVALRTPELDKHDQIIVALAAAG